jgi:integrase
LRLERQILVENHNTLYHRDFKSLLKRAGLWPEDKRKCFTFHSLRHTCATLLLSKYVNPKLLGHATITQTMDTYSHVLPGMGDAAASALEEALS